MKFSRAIFSIAFLLCFAAQSAWSQPALPAAGEAVPPLTKANSQESGAAVQVQSLPPAFDPATSRILDLNLYLWWECRVNWNQYCDANKDFYAWPKYQACKMLYELDPGNHGITSGPNATPSVFFVLDPIDPPGFRKYTVSFHAEGKFAFPNAYDALLRLNNVGIRMLPEDATYEERVAAQCEFPIPP